MFYQPLCNAHTLKGRGADDNARPSNALPKPRASSSLIGKGGSHNKRVDHSLLASQSSEPNPNIAAGCITWLVTIGYTCALRGAGHEEERLGLMPLILSWPTLLA